MERHPDDTDHDLPAQPPLAPCPWCGTPPILMPALRHGFFVSCDNEHCTVKPEVTQDAETPEQAAERWNTRHIPQAA